ncbi:MAG: hypothetical protein WCF77_04225, partial [Minisyncoccia bacterium]
WGERFFSFLDPGFGSAFLDGARNKSLTTSRRDDGGVARDDGKKHGMTEKIKSTGPSPSRRMTY